MPAFLRKNNDFNKHANFIIIGKLTNTKDLKKFCDNASLKENELRIRAAFSFLYDQYHCSHVNIEFKRHHFARRIFYIVLLL